MAALAGRGLDAGLAVVLVGDDPASEVYVGRKMQDGAEVGIRSFEHRLPADTAEAELLALIARLNADPGVHGILVPAAAAGAYRHRPRARRDRPRRRTSTASTRSMSAASRPAPAAWSRAPRSA